MWLTLLALVLMVDASSGATAVSPDKVLSNNAAMLADNSATLAFSLYQNMAKEKKTENILISPVVLASSLGLVALGGKSSTSSQVKTLLNAEKVKDDLLHTGLKELLSEVTDPKTRNVTWKISNRLYGPSSVAFVSDFVKSSKKLYNYENFKISFKDKKKALNTINKWAEKSTDGKLPEIAKDVEKTDGAMLITAMFYKPHWDEQFHHQMVDNRGFMVSRSYTISVQMMHRTGIYGFLDDTVNEASILSMHLAHKKSSLLMILPYQVGSLEKLEKILNKEQMDSWTKKLEQRAVAVSLPKVKMDVSHDLQKHLQILGLTEAVDKSKADFSNISGKKDLYVSSLFHASAMEWDTPGNALNASVFSSDALKDPKLFYVDHPFIFLVQDHVTQSILFIGRMLRPKGEKMRDEL